MPEKHEYEPGVGRPRSADPLSVQIAFRTTPAMRDAFAGWLARENARRVVPMSEAEALRVLMGWAARASPSLDELNRVPPGHPPASD